MALEDLAVLRRTVWVDQQLLGQLSELEDHEAFVAAVLELAVARGLSVSRLEVEAEMAAHRRVWLERWL